MRRLQPFGQALCALILFSASAMQASVITYNNPSAFTAASGSLFTQTFAVVGANLGVPANFGTTINNPLDNTTNSGMLPGLSISAFTNLGNDIAVLAPDFFFSGLTNYTVFSNFPNSGLTFTFGSGVTAASLNLLTLFNSADVNIDVFDPSSALLGSFTVTGAPNTGSGEFWGVTSSGGSVIGSIAISAADGSFAGVDQVQFGSAVPEPASLVLLGTGLIGAIGAFRRKINL